MANLGSLKVYLTADTKKFNSGLSRAQIGMRKFSKSARGITTAIAGIAGVSGAAFAALNSMASIGDEIGKGAKKIGVSAEEFQKLGFAARRSGSDVGAVNTAFKRMASTIFDASNGLAESKRAINAVGLSVDDLKGKRPEEQFRLIASSLNRVEDASTKAALAQDFFGRSGTELLPMLKDYNALAEEASEHGIITDEQVKAAEKFKDTMENIGMAIKSALINSGALQYINDLVEGMKALSEYGYWKTLFGDEGDGNMAAATEAELYWQREKSDKRRMKAHKARRAALKNEIKLELDASDAAKKRAKKELDLAEKLEKKRQQAFKVDRKTLAEIDKDIGMMFDTNFKKFGIELTAPEKEELKMILKGEGEGLEPIRLAEALQAGSREAFSLRTAGRFKTEKRNLKANERTAREVSNMANNGLYLRDVAVVQRV